jgi:stromal membrane-associated protein
MGNSRARAVYEALLSDNFRRPQTDSGLESFIRAKYEQKKYIAREWIPPPFPPKVDWEKEIEEELENQKRKKKAASSSAIIQEPPKSKPVQSTANIIPAPLPKPTHSPKSSRLSSDAKKIATVPAPANSSNSTDLLGLETAMSNNVAPPPSATAANASTKGNENTLTDAFDFFSNSTLTPPPSSSSLTTSSSTVTPTQQTKNGGGNNESSLKQEEDDFFNQKSFDNGADKGKLTKDNILALYGKSPSPFQAPTGNSPQVPAFNANFHQQPPPQASQDLFFGLNSVHQQAPQQQQHFGGQPIMYSNNANNGNFIGNIGFGTMQSQQINRLNEENIRKIESLNFNSFK